MKRKGQPRGAARMRWTITAAILAGLSAGAFAMQAAPGAAEWVPAPPAVQGPGGDDAPATGRAPATVVLFGEDSSRVAADYRRMLARDVVFMRRHPQAAVILQGYTDPHGDQARDLKLGLERALAVSRVLEDSGIERDRIEAVSYGAGVPVAGRSGAPDRTAERRVTLRYVAAATPADLDIAELGVTSPLLGIPVQ